jgi:hypothetical protein
MTIRWADVGWLFLPCSLETWINEEGGSEAWDGDISKIDQLGVNPTHRRQLSNIIPFSLPKYQDP